MPHPSGWGSSPELHRRLNQKLWDRSKKDLESLVPGSERLPGNILRFIHTSEFLNVANHRKADFSGVILTYAKAFETILDEKVGRPFVESFCGKRPKFPKRTNYLVKRLFPTGQDRHRSIGIGEWHVIIKEIRKGEFERSNEINKRFVAFLKNLGNAAVKTIRKYSKALAETRNGVAHLSQIDKNSAQEKLKLFREAIAALTDVFG